MSDFKKMWENECREEGGQWFSGDPEGFSRKRALLFDAVRFSKAELIMLAIIALTFPVIFIVYTFFMFKGVSDYFISLAFFIVLAWVCNYVWKMVAKNDAAVAEEVNGKMEGGH